MKLDAFSMKILNSFEFFFIATTQEVGLFLMAAYITAYIDLEIICMPGTQKCQKTFIAFFHVLVPHPVIRVSMPKQKRPLMLLFTSKQTVIYVRPWGN